MAEALTITDDRIQVGLEATWEVDALCAMARDLAEDVGHTLEQTELMRLALQLRGVVLRIERLNSALMAVLGDDEETAQLQKKVLGVSMATLTGRRRAMSELRTLQRPDRVIPDKRARLAFDAGFEIASLASVLQRLIDEANLDGLGKACCGMLIRMEQLGEVIGACVDEDPVGSYGMNDDNLRRVVLGPSALSTDQG